MVRKKSLLGLASLVWMIAGFNVFKIGIDTYINYISVINIILSFLVFGVFWYMVFYKLVVKHTLRIKNFQQPKQYFWKFFDMKSFIIVAVMMTGGVTIRIFHLLPEQFIAVFYSGLGAALFLAGLLFGYNYLTNEREN